MEKCNFEWCLFPATVRPDLSKLLISQISHSKVFSLGELPTVLTFYASDHPPPLITTLALPLGWPFSRARFDSFLRMTIHEPRYVHTYIYLYACHVYILYIYEYISNSIGYIGVPSHFHLLILAGWEGASLSLSYQNLCRRLSSFQKVAINTS